MKKHGTLYTPNLQKRISVISNQELLTLLFKAIALGFVTIAAIDFGTRSVVTYKQISAASNPSKINTQLLTKQSPPVAPPQELPKLPDPWLLPLTAAEALVSAKLPPIEQKHLRLLSPAKKSSTAPKLELEDLLPEAIRFG